MTDKTPTARLHWELVKEIIVIMEPDVRPLAIKAGAKKFNHLTELNAREIAEAIYDGDFSREDSLGVHYIVIQITPQSRADYGLPEDGKSEHDWQMELALMRYRMPEEAHQAVIDYIGNSVPDSILCTASGELQIWVNDVLVWPRGDEKPMMTRGTES